MSITHRPPMNFVLSTVMCLTLGATLLLPGAAHAETLRLGGTGSALGTMKLLGEGYRKVDPSFVLEIVPNLGSSGGITALTAGAVQVGVISRPLKVDETAAGLQAIEYGTTPFVLATAKSGINELSLGQIADLYSGKQTKWVDGQSVRLVLRPASDGDSALLGAFSPAVKSALAIAMTREGMVIGMTDQDTVDAIERLPGAIGTASLAVLKSENRRAVALAIDGVAPTVANLSNGSYPYHKRMYLVVKGAPGAAVSKFVAFVGSDAGRRILADSGHAVAHEQAVAGKAAIKAGR